MKYVLRQWLKLKLIIGVFLILPFNFVISEEKENVISYTQFLNEMEMGKIKEIKIYCQKKIKGKYKDENTFVTNIPYYDEDLIKIAKKNNVILWYGKEPSEKETPMWINMVPAMILIVVLSAFLGWIFYNRRWGLLKSKTLYEEKVPEYLNDLIKKLDTLIEVLKEKK